MTVRRRIACLGWGSLVWSPDRLPVELPWREDGPALPVEFTRRSNNGRLTLVLTEGVPRIPVLWVPIKAETVKEAREALRVREGVVTRNLDRDVGFCELGVPSPYAEAESIAVWA